jgi:hypothetical protein
MSHSITVSPKPASEPGALDGFEARCTCGYHGASSLGERWAVKLGNEHVAWAVRTGK